MPLLLVRPIIFGVVFFVIYALINILVAHFLPELLEEGGGYEEDTGLLSGSRVDIMEGESDSDSGLASRIAENQAIMGARPDDEDHSLDDISNLAERAASPRARVQSGMDQNGEEGYSEDGALNGFSGSAGADTAFFDSGDVLPDLDSMAGAFGASSSAEGGNAAEYSGSSPARKSSSGKSSEWSGDFDAKEIASGIRTVLNKDKEG
jgi:hypothetical protein